MKHPPLNSVSVWMQSLTCVNQYVKLSGKYFQLPPKNVAYSHISDMLKPRSAVHTLCMQEDSTRVIL